MYVNFQNKFCFSLGSSSSDSDSDSETKDEKVPASTGGESVQISSENHNDLQVVNQCDNKYEEEFDFKCNLDSENIVPLPTNIPEDLMNVSCP